MLDRGLDRLIARGYVAQRKASGERARARGLVERLAKFVRAGTRPLRIQESRVLVTDAAGVIVGRTPAAAHWLNVPAESLVGMRLLHFVGRRDTRTFRGIVKGLGYAGADRAAVVRFRPRRGLQELVHASVEKVGPNRFAWTLRPVER